MFDRLICYPRKYIVADITWSLNSVSQVHMLKRSCCKAQSWPNEVKEMINDESLGNEHRSPYSTVCAHEFTYSLTSRISMVDVVIF